MKEFIEELSDVDAAAVVAAMQDAGTWVSRQRATCAAGSTRSAPAATRRCSGLCSPPKAGGAPELAEAALRRRQLLRELANRRERLGLSQTAVAARMGTSQSAVARLEAGELDAKFSTVERFAAALGHKVEWRVAKARPR